MMDQVNAAVSKAVGKVARMAVRGIVKSAQANGLIQVEAHSGDSFDSAELWQQAGFSSRPTSGAEAIVIKIGASGDHPVVIATTLRSARPAALALGDAAMHCLTAGTDRAEVHCKQAGDLDLNCKAGSYAHLGGSTGAEKAILGETFGAALDTFVDALIAATTVAEINTAASALLVAMGGVSSPASLLTTKAKVA